MRELITSLRKELKEYNQTALSTKKQLNRSWKTTSKKNGSIDGLQGWLVVSCILKWINLIQMTPLIHYVVQTNAPFFNSEQDMESLTTTGTGLMHPAHRFAETVRIPMRQQNTCCWNAQGWFKSEKKLLPTPTTIQNTLYGTRTQLLNTCKYLRLLLAV